MWVRWIRDLTNRAEVRPCLCPSVSSPALPVPSWQLEAKTRWWSWMRNGEASNTSWYQRAAAATTNASSSRCAHTHTHTRSTQFLTLPVLLVDDLIRNRWEEMCLMFCPRREREKKNLHTSQEKSREKRLNTKPILSCKVNLIAYLFR